MFELIIGHILSLWGMCVAGERAAFTYPSITTVDIKFSALTLRFLAGLIDSFPLRIKGATGSLGSGRANAPSSSAGNDVLTLFCHHGPPVNQDRKCSGHLRPTHEVIRTFQRGQYYRARGRCENEEVRQIRLPVSDQGVTLAVSYDQNSSQKTPHGLCRVSTSGQTLDTCIAAMRAAGTPSTICRSASQDYQQARHRPAGLRRISSAVARSCQTE
jgi:hypothetical protein